MRRYTLPEILAINVGIEKWTNIYYACVKKDIKTVRKLVKKQCQLCEIWRSKSIDFAKEDCLKSDGEARPCPLYPIHCNTYSTGKETYWQFRKEAREGSPYNNSVVRIPNPFLAARIVNRLSRAVHKRPFLFDLGALSRKYKNWDSRPLKNQVED